MLASPVIERLNEMIFLPENDKYWMMVARNLQSDVSELQARMISDMFLATIPMPEIDTGEAIDAAPSEADTTGETTPSKVGAPLLLPKVEIEEAIAASEVGAPLLLPKDEIEEAIATASEVGTPPKLETGEAVATASEVDTKVDIDAPSKVDTGEPITMTSKGGAGEVITTSPDTGDVIVTKVVVGSKRGTGEVITTLPDTGDVIVTKVVIGSKRPLNSIEDDGDFIPR